MSVFQRLHRGLKHFAGLLLMGGVFLTYSSTAEAPLDVRVALVIGNAAYAHIPALGNSTNDARSMATILRKLGFQVVEVVDGSKVQIDHAIENLQALLKGKQAVAMLYYAGHGLQLDWHNYMVPVDAKLAQSSDVPRQTVDIENVISSFKKSATRMNIIVLDACRDNPFEGKASGKGLAQLDAPVGTFLAFATAPGNVAEDGDVSSGNGLFTQYLLQELQKPARIEDVFKRVRLQVRQKSQGRQIPWDSSSLEEDFAFNDGNKHTVNPDELIKEAKAREEKLRAEAQAVKQKELQIAKEREIEAQKLAEAQKIKDLQARQKAEAESKERERQLALAAEQEKQKAILAAQAIEKVKAEEVQKLKEVELARVQAAEEAKNNRLSSEEAREKQFAVEKSDWDKIKDSQNADDFYAYLNKYPNGLISQQATFKLESLAKAKITTQADKNGLVQKLGEPRFRVGDSWVIVVRDDYTGNTIAKLSKKVSKIENGLVYIESESGSELRTVDGGVIKAQNHETGWTFDPPRIDMPGDELSVGKKWTSTTTETSSRSGIKYNRTEEIKIVAFEKITVPAGTFLAYKFEASGYSGNSRVQHTYWYEPDWGIRIKYIRKVFRARGSAVLETHELESRTRGPITKMANAA